MNVTDLVMPKYEVTRVDSSTLISVQISDCEALMTAPEFLASFSERELDYIFSKARGAHSLSARYAAKVGAESISHIPWYQFEITRTAEGIPQLLGRNERACTYLDTYPILLSLAHDEPLALAYLMQRF